MFLSFVQKWQFVGPKKAVLQTIEAYGTHALKIAAGRLCEDVKRLIVPGFEALAEEKDIINEEQADILGLKDLMILLYYRSFRIQALNKAAQSYSTSAYFRVRISEYLNHLALEGGKLGTDQNGKPYNPGY